MKEQVWVPLKGSIYLNSKQEDYPSKLDVGIYELGFNDKYGFNLTSLSSQFDFPYKIYGLETDLIRRVEKYYRKTNVGNLGILLNGIKGTGKTVTAKQICNNLNLPVILITTGYDGAQEFINSIQQDIIVFIDEYEKIYEQSHDFLTIMDGALNSPFRRTFILTTNNLHIDSNLIDRPSRIRYLKSFSNLKVEVVAEIVDDLLQYPEFRNECISYISTLELITVDIIKAIVNEVNIQEESPKAFKSVFNASVKTGRYVIYIENGETITQLLNNAKLSRRPDYDESDINGSFYINDIYIGRIKQIIDLNTVSVLIEASDDDDDDDDDDEAFDTDSSETKRVKTPLNLPAGLVNFVIKEDFVYNDIYKYKNRDFSNIETAI